MSFSSNVDRIMGGFSLEQKIGQLFIFPFTSLVQAQNELRFHPGGYIRIYSDALTLARQNAAIQRESAIPLLISANFERGINSTVSGAFEGVTNMALGATGDEDLVRRYSCALAEESLAIGVNMNCAPVLDVNLNPSNPVINTRAFGADPELVVRLGAAYIRGHRDAGVVTCAKHFPGHGDTVVDSHSDMGTVSATRARLDEVELLPFRTAIAAGVDSIMSAHLHFPSLDPNERLPATLSRNAMHHLLREELGFAGVLVSDGMDMGAISRNFSPEDAVVRAVNAGIDLLMMPMHPARSFAALLEGVRDGKVSESRIDEAVARVLTLKESRGLFEHAPRSLTEVPENLHRQLQTREHQDLALDVARRAVTVVDDPKSLLPLKRDARVAVLTFSNSQDERGYYLEPPTLGAHLSTRMQNVDTLNFGAFPFSPGDRILDHAFLLAETADIVVVGAFIRVVLASGDIGLQAHHVELLNRLKSLGKPLVLVSFGNPYIDSQFAGADAFVRAFGATEPLQQAASETMIN